MNSNDRKFYELVEEYVMKYLKLNPIQATYLGVHEFDTLMPRGDKRGIYEQRNLLLEFKDAISEINPIKLSRITRIDYKIALDTIKLYLFYIDEWPLWRMYPFAGENIGEALFPLFMREFAPFSERLSSIISRIEKSPRYLKESMECLEEPVKIYVEIALMNSKMLPLFLDVINNASSQILGKDNVLTQRVREGTEKLKDSISDYIKWLSDIKDNAKEEFAIGRERFEKLLKLRGIELSIEHILKLGEDYLSSFKRQLSELANKIMPGATIDEVRDKLERNHPENFDAALEEYRKSIERARKFILDKRIAPIPEGEKLKVVETPHYLRPVIPFAAYFSPAPFEKEKIGIYIVTPPTKPEHMRRHNYYSISNTSVHEAYPGHHLQLSWAATVKNLVRIISVQTEFIEGWAHYCEDLMKEYGFDDTLEHKFVQLLDSIWRAVRIIVDVKLSVGMMTFNEAVDFLVKEAKMDREAALAEVRRYTYTPGYQLSYLLGKHLLHELRNEVRKVMGDKYDDYVFHSLILKTGGMPYKYLREYVLEELKKSA